MASRDQVVLSTLKQWLNSRVFIMEAIVDQSGQVLILVHPLSHMKIVYAKH